MKTLSWLFWISVVAYPVLGSESRDRENPFANTITTLCTIVGSNVGTQVIYLAGDGTFVGLSTTFYGYTSQAPNGHHGLVRYQPGSGTYTVQRDAVDPDHGFLYLDFGDDVSREEYWFRDARGGALEPRGSGSSFSVQPRTVLSGAANVSNRTWVEPGRASITGFIVPEGTRQFVLVRAVGPGLREYGVDEALATPSLELHSASEVVAPLLGFGPKDHGPGVTAVTRLAGAFPLADGSNDRSALFMLEPGAHTVITRGEAAKGEVLTEVYLLPFSG
ncbi:hypothetical protein DB347_15070 [Opitutaceae bacterium EW11]|nr:hypothetical protein DB347_15070 [Opitutaceae bacterium EW11]